MSAPTLTHTVSQRKVLTVVEAAAAMGVSRRTVYNWLKLGRLDTTKTPSGRTYIYADSLWKDAPVNKTPDAPVE